MRSYIIMIAGASLLSVFADMMSPDEWRKYMKIITGLIILSVIVTPILHLKDIDLFTNFELDSRLDEMGETKQAELVQEELTRRVQEDAEQRMKTEFNVDAKVTAELSVNEQDEIQGVNSLTVHTPKHADEIKKRLADVYGVNENEVIVINE